MLGAALLAGCSLEEERPEEIPPPPTPTDHREARRIENAASVYRRDTRLIRSEVRRCSRGLPPSFVEPVCGPGLRPLVAQRRTHLRVTLAGLQQRVGPRCRRGLRRVRDVPIGAAGAVLVEAARACSAEYRQAFSAPGRG